MTLLTRLTPHRQPLCASTLILIVALCASALHLWSSLDTRYTQLDQFGQTLADSAAQRAVDATISQDMISLQVVLQELTRHPQVLGATVHDVENRLLVQSGFSPSERDRDYHHYSAPVALADNIAGHLQVILAPPRLGASDYQLLALLWLMTVIAALIPWWPRLRESEGQVRPPLSPPTEKTGESDTDSAAPEEPAFDPVALRLQLDLTNLHELGERINQRSFEQQLEQFQHQLRNILSLYGGQWIAMVDQTLLVDFQGESHSDCAFRALCSAQLLSELSHLNPGPRLKLRTRIYARAPSSAPALCSDFYYQHRELQPPAQGIEIDPQLIDEALQDHLDMDTKSGVLIAVKAPYRQLLDRQQEQLQALTTPVRD